MHQIIYYFFILKLKILFLLIFGFNKKAISVLETSAFRIDRTISNFEEEKKIFLKEIEGFSPELDRFVFFCKPDFSTPVNHNIKIPFSRLFAMKFFFKKEEKLQILRYYDYLLENGYSMNYICFKFNIPCVPKKILK